MKLTHGYNTFENTRSFQRLGDRRNVPLFGSLSLRNIVMFYNLSILYYYCYLTLYINTLILASVSLFYSLLMLEIEVEVEVEVGEV